MSENKHVEIPSFLTVRELAELLEASPIDVIKELMSNRIIARLSGRVIVFTWAMVVPETWRHRRRFNAIALAIASGSAQIIIRRRSSREKRARRRLNFSAPEFAMANILLSEVSIG